MIVYFAGVNTYHFCDAFLGRHVLETFADPRERLFGRYRAAFRSMALDCGAYSELTTGKPIDLHAYADFVAQHGEFYDWCASLDSIQGGVKQNLQNWQFLSDSGLDTMPTYHQGEPISVLEDYCSVTDRVGLGFSGRPITGARAFLDEAFSHIPSSVRVHGWAMTNYTARYPFASVDSKTWLHELLALRSVVPELQKSFSLGHLTDGELIEIVQKKYDRLPRAEVWSGGVTTSKQFGLFKETA